MLFNFIPIPAVLQVLGGIFGTGQLPALWKLCESTLNNLGIMLSPYLIC